MKYIPNDYGKRCRFDAFCKTILRNEARTYLRDLCRERNRETEFSALSQHERDKLCTMDGQHPIHGIRLRSAYPGRACGRSFSSLPEQEQSILILYCVLELADSEICGIAGISRSTVQRHRTKTLDELQRNLESKVVRN